MLELTALIVGFILLSGFMALMDAAILSVSAAEVEAMVKQKKAGAAVLRKVVNSLNRAVVVIVIMTNLINVLGPILVGQKAIELFGSTVIGIITGILTFGTIVFSEIIPKSLGAHYAPRVSRMVAPIILTAEYVLLPVVIPLEKMASLLQSGDRAIGTEDQIRALVMLGRKEGHIESDEGQLIHRAFILNDKTAADVMTPLKDIVSIPQDATVREAAEKVFDNPYSRYPVFGNSIHDVIGLGMSHDILESLAQGADEEPITNHMRDALVVDSNVKSDELMVLFRDKHIHLAVVQEDDHTVGIVSLEDVLEELVGEIEDEKDSEDS